MAFTKLDSGILRSSIMSEPADVFKVWIALLASVDADGIARVSATFLSAACYLPLETVREALDKFSRPDPDSRSVSSDGRRAVRVDGGYRIINYEKYREFSYSMTPEAIRQRKSRENRACSSDGFDAFWKRYPRHVAKQVAVRAYEKAIGNGATPEELARAVEGYRSELTRLNTGEKYCLHASTFLHEDRWRDYLGKE